MSHADFLYKPPVWNIEGNKIKHYVTIPKSVSRKTLRVGRISNLLKQIIMKKLILSITIVSVLISNSSCGTILGGHITECQRHKPATGSREIRPAALIGDIFIGGFVINLIVDFADGAIYKPCRDTPKK
jgi:hypothetical protein